MVAASLPFPFVVGISSPHDAQFETLIQFATSSTLVSEASRQTFDLSHQVCRALPASVSPQVLADTCPAISSARTLQLELRLRISPRHRSLSAGLPGVASA